MVIFFAQLSPSNVAKLNPLSGVHKAVTTASSNGHIFCVAISLQRGQVKPIIRSTHNCNYSLRYWSYVCAATSLQRGQVGVVDTRNM